MRAVFMGSPAFAVPSLLRLAELTDVAGVVTQPDRPAGRGRALHPPEVKVAASRLGLDITQPERLRDPAFLSWLGDRRPDLIVVAAYGRILKSELLSLPRLGCINVHASLLPRWRGASPIQAAILAGDDTTGVTIMRMDEGMDTGPTFAQQTIPIGPQETGGELSLRLADLGAALLASALPGIINGTLRPTPQQDDGATYAPLLTKADGGLDPSKSAADLARQVRAFHPWPGSFVEMGANRLAVLRARAAEGHSGTPGTFINLAGEPAMLTARGALVFEQVQPAGRRPQAGRDFLRGVRDFPGEPLAPS